MMNLAAKKKSKETNKHRNCNCTSDAAMANALLKNAAIRRPRMQTAFSLEGTDAGKRPGISRNATVESASSCIVELVDGASSTETCTASASPPACAPPDRPMLDKMAPTTTTTTTTTAEDPFFRLNVGGKSYRFRYEVLISCREPSLLSALAKATHEQRLRVADSFLEASGEYYFERNVRVADHVLDYFITGLLHKPNDVCSERFREELGFWKLKNDQLAPCCSVLNELPRIKTQDDDDSEFDGVWCADARWAVWRIMEDPSSSFYSKLFSFLSIGFIFASVIGLIMGSMPEFQEDNSQAHLYHVIHQRRVKSNASTSKFDPEPVSALLADFTYKATDNPNSILVALEYVCIAWFSLEYLLRLLVAPQKSKFVMASMNLIDLFTILPFYVELSLSVFGINANEMKDLYGDNKKSFSRKAQSWIGAMLVIRVLRVLRMARVFKLARYSQGLQIFGNTLRASMTELSMLSMFLVTGTIFFSTVMYFLEKDEPNTDFYSIPAACWWCITTVTTVGYGDTFPISTAGKSVATAASICGIIILAFPISMIVEKFASAQQQALIEDQMKQAQMAAVANDYLLKRFPTRRKACKDPLLASIIDKERKSMSVA